MRRFLLSLAAGALLTTTMGVSPASAAAPPEACASQEAYGTPGWWSKVTVCLTSHEGRPVIKIDTDCQYKSLALYSKVRCRVTGKYTLSRLSAKNMVFTPIELQSGSVMYGTDPIHSGHTAAAYDYACDGRSFYTVKVTNLETKEIQPGGYSRGNGTVPDVEVRASGC
ncbi:hypothetical protein ACFY7H_22165 [Streptomyces sp. NPDC012794]|uniref:hypothetical protein n=1 Tax=Streptomyces sp. NPDC012794 TaxID=3364850 RepID=UPI0036B51A85